MNKIEKLILELCPGGVMTVNLGSITSEQANRNISKSISEVRSVTNNMGLVRTSDFFENTRTSQDTSNYKIAEPNMIVYNPSRINVGSIARHKESIPVIVSPMYVVVKLDDKCILPEYLDLFLSSENGRGQIVGSVEVGARFRFTYEQFSRLKIQLPPLAVQEAIVKILDSFKELEVELEAELEARKKQYEYYRDELLNISDVKYGPLSDFGFLIRGNGLQKKDFVEEGVGCIHYGQLYTFYGTSAEKTKSFISLELSRKLKKAQKGDVLISGVSENIDDVCKPLAWLGDEICISGDMFAYRHNQNTKFITYILQSTNFNKYKEKYAQGAKVTRVSADRILKYEIPVIPLEEQAKIVSILDKFDALVNDISIGLPAELKARRQQYEYYRNKLLTFKELKD